MKNILFILSLIFSVSSFADQNSQSKLIETKSSNWKIYPLMSVGDHSKKNHFRLVGTPDGLGVEKEDNFKIKVYMNHEIANDKGIVRSHGGRGAFVSQWTLDLNLLKIISYKIIKF